MTVVREDGRVVEERIVEQGPGAPPGASPPEPFIDPGPSFVRLVSRWPPKMTAYASARMERWCTSASAPSGDRGAGRSTTWPGSRPLWRRSSGSATLGLHSQRRTARPSRDRAAARRRRFAARERRLHDEHRESRQRGASRHRLRAAPVGRHGARGGKFGDDHSIKGTCHGRGRANAVGLPEQEARDRFAAAGLGVTASLRSFRTSRRARSSRRTPARVSVCRRTHLCGIQRLEGVRSRRCPHALSACRRRTPKPPRRSRARGQRVPGAVDRACGQRRRAEPGGWSGEDRIRRAPERVHRNAAVG